MSSDGTWIMTPDPRTVTEEHLYLGRLICEPGDLSSKLGHLRDAGVPMPAVSRSTKDVHMATTSQDRSWVTVLLLKFWDVIGAWVTTSQTRSEQKWSLKSGKLMSLILDSHPSPEQLTAMLNVDAVKNHWEGDRGVWLYVLQTCRPVFLVTGIQVTAEPSRFVEESSQSTSAQAGVGYTGWAGITPSVTADCETSSRKESEYTLAKDTLIAYKLHMIRPKDAHPRLVPFVPKKKGGLWTGDATDTAESQPGLFQLTSEELGGCAYDWTKNPHTSVVKAAGVDELIVLRPNPSTSPMGPSDDEED